MPKLAKATKNNLKFFSTVIYKSDDCTLTIYKNKPSKKVTVLNSRYKCVKTEDNRKRVPETVTYYNKTKFGVDLTDQMAWKYIKSECCRWPA